MMREIILLPNANSLIQSMRDIGYSLETALADLIDNSITANATNIDITLNISGNDNSFLTIIDNGSGMTQAELVEAMRPGSKNPREQRHKNDLGRFGLGLKTASFSQCKSLIVVSRKNTEIFAAQWDLDLIQERNDWVVNILNTEEIESLPNISEIKSHGTYVLWQKLDRLLENNFNESNQEKVYDKLSVVNSHLGLVFHRYISGDYKKQKIAIQINGYSVAAFDPFCTSNRATQVLHEEIVRIDNHKVHIQPYILPHHSKFTKEEYDYYQERSDFLNNQGVYVYRNGRLMAWGDWFRIVPKTEDTKLARVQIDFSNELDDYWTIDIKKSRAQPPYEVREMLRQIISRITKQSQRVHKGRGDKVFDKQKQPLWVRYSDRGGIRYVVDRQHPLINIIENSLDIGANNAFHEVLSVIERSIPIEAIYADYASSPGSFERTEDVAYETLKEELQTLFTLMASSGSMDKANFSRMILGLKPFNENPEIVEKIVEELT